MKIHKNYMLKATFHKNSIKIFATLEKIGILKLTRSLLSKNYQSSNNIQLWRFMLTTPELHKSKEYAGLPNDYSIKAAVEHGPFFGDFIWPQDINNPLPAIITFSKNRAEFLEKKTNKKNFSIGPYIHYAKHYLTKSRLKRERKRLGKNLLVFPFHETSITKLDYDIDELCREIKSIGKRFDSIRICLYWKDILNKKDEFYKKHGFETVTAGHIFDPNFLPRLKSIIEVSTATMSNGFGTYIGYSTFMNKPHYLFVQKIKFRKLNVDAKRALAIWKNSIFREMLKALSIFSTDTTSKQYNLVSSFFGFDQIKTPEQMKKIFEVCENLWQKRKS